MIDRKLLFRSSALAAAVLAACSLAACNRSGASAGSASADALPLTTAETAPPPSAPAADVLPAAAPAPVVRVRNPEDAYAYLDDAYYEGAAFEDAPSDYAFDYGGTTPWAWQGDDGWEFVEPVDNSYRYYYYRPGAAWPYLIRDGGYAYGYDGQQLVAVYDQGRLLQRADIDRRADLAGRYLARSQGILEASRQSGRRGVAAANWAAARAGIAANRAQLSAERSRQSAWQAYDQAHAAQATRWDAERGRRQDYAQRFEGWRRADFQGAPPAPTGASRRDAPVRQARIAPPTRQGEPAVGPTPGPGQRPIAPNQARGFADQRQAGQEQQRQQAEQQRQVQAATQQRQAQDQRQADQQRRFAEQQQQQRQSQAAVQQRQVQDQRQADQHRGVAEQQQRQAGQEQQRAQADQAQQQRQAQEQRRQQAEQQQRAQGDQARQQAQQQRPAQEQQRQQAQQQQRAQAEQGRQQQAVQQQAAQQQQRLAQGQARQQAQQQQHQAQEQTRQQAVQQHPPSQPGQPPAAHPAGQNEHRENKHDDKQQ